MFDIDNSAILKPLRGSIKKKQFIGFDIETTNDGTEFVSMALWDTRTDSYIFFTDQEEAANEMLRYKYRNCTFIATNLTFDFCGVYWDHPVWNKFKTIMQQGDFLAVHYTLRERERVSKKGTKYTEREVIEFADTINYVAYGVEKLGSIIGFDKITPPDWLGKKRPQNRTEWETLKKYNVRDAEISAKFMVFVQETIIDLGGEMQLTSASTSLNLFRRKYLKRYWVKESSVTKRDVEPLIRDAYYGGRTEAFARGYIKDANYYDINSLYPSVMRNEFPLPQSAEYIREPAAYLIKVYHGVSTVKIRAPKNIHIPLLPKRHNDKLMFPRGTFTGSYNHVELRAAMKLGYKILEVTKQLIYTEVFSPFKEYVEDLYEKRLEYQQQGSPMQLVVKLMLNSLYGKFAQSTVEDVRITRLEGLSNKEIVKSLGKNYDALYDYDTHILTKKEKQSKGVFIFPIMSSYCTSYARLKLYEYLQKYNPLYCDTDSIITFDEIPTSAELGAMKLEMRIDEGVLVRAKFYRANEYIKIKGVNRATREDFEKLLQGYKVEQLRVSKPRGSLRLGIPINKFYYVQKEVDVEDDKRHWTISFNPKELQYSIPIEV